jgi:Zn-finger nucleic acid-binding protein
MRKALIRLSCPVCLGVALEVTSVTSGAKIHHCRRCGGTWLLRGQIASLRSVPARALRIMIRRADEAGFLCHDCHAPMDRDAASCPACGWENALECPDCGKPMRRQSENGVAVDVCRGCQGVWLDHHELSLLWTAAAAGALVQAREGTNMTWGGDVPSFPLDGLWPAPDLPAAGMGDAAASGMELASHAGGSGMELASHTSEVGMHAAANAPEIGGLADGASGLGEAAGGLGEAVGGLGEAAGGLGEAAGGLAEVAGGLAEGAGAVFELIATIIAGIFEGLGSISG